MVYHTVSQDGAHAPRSHIRILGPEWPPPYIRSCKVHPSFQCLFEHKKTLEHWCQWCSWGIEGPETHGSVFGWLVKLVPNWETRKSTTAMGNPEIFPWGKWSPVVSVAEIIAIARFDCLGAGIEFGQVGLRGRRWRRWVMLLGINSVSMVTCIFSLLDPV